MKVRIGTFMLAIAALAVVLGVARWLWHSEPLLAFACMVCGSTAAVGGVPFAVAFRFRGRDPE